MAIGAVAGVPILGPLLSNMKQGDRGLQSKYTVDNVGFGNTGARDEFGLATFDKKDGFLGLTGNTTRNYVDRMNERLGELDKFFSERIEGFDINNLDDATLSEMSKINNFYTKQIQAYKQRTAVEDINKRTQDAIQAQKIQDNSETRLQLYLPCLHLFSVTTLLIYLIYDQAQNKLVLCWSLNLL